MSRQTTPYLLLLLLAPASIGGAADTWELVWSDEFDQTGLPDAQKWSYEKGFLRNKEAQYYTVKRDDNATVSDGVLKITARRESYQPADHDGPAVNYTSASLHTFGKAQWTFGRFEIRAKLPAGRGTWPAIWMLGSNIGDVGWPKCGEIDIMEHVGFDPHRVHANIHTQRYNHMLKTGKGDHRDVPEATTAFHTYRVDWYPDRLEFFIDGEAYFEYQREELEGAWPFDKPHYLILNLAIGGTWGGREGIDDSIFPCTYEIDYVRVYQQPAP